MINKVLVSTWRRLRKGEKVLMMYNDICDLEEYVHSLSLEDSHLFDKHFIAIQDKRLSCGVTYKDHVCSLEQKMVKNVTANILI